MAAQLRVVFAGTPSFALPSLEAVRRCGHELVGVLTQPDRPAGRGRRFSASPVKLRAADLGVPIQQPDSLREPAARMALQALAPELLVVVAYGLILPPEVLSMPAHGCVNVHASLLPRWRGAAPVQRAILAGDAETGVSIMQMEAGLDTGPVLLAERMPIEPADTGQTLAERLAGLGGRLLAEYFAALAAGRLRPRPQDESRATYAPKLSREEAQIDWRRSAVDIDRQIRALNPWPVAETRCAGRRLRIWQASRLAERAAPPGTVVEAGPGGLVVAAGDGAVRIDRLQLEGRRAVSAADFLNAWDLQGERFG